jgi:hypothetical protein
MEILLKGIEDNASMRLPARPPSNDAMSEDVDDKGHVAKPGHVASGLRSADALLLPEPYVHILAHTALYISKIILANDIIERHKSLGSRHARRRTDVGSAHSPQ